MSNTRFNAKIARSSTFDRDSNKVADFVTVYKLYIRMKIREVSVEKQVQ